MIVDEIVYLPVGFGGGNLLLQLVEPVTSAAP